MQDNMNKIKMQTDGTLTVPDVPVIPFITGDGVGAEVTPSMQAVVNAAVRKAYGDRRRIEWKEVLAGEKAFNLTGSWLQDETMEVFREYLVGIKGPLTTPVGGGIRSLNVALRPDTRFVCLPSPCSLVSGCSHGEVSGESEYVSSRENTEDIYAASRWEAVRPKRKNFIVFKK